MPGTRPGLFRFWQELKRRKVIRVMTVYAATSFIILEASDIVLPRLGLPEWTVTFLIVLIAVGFPIVAILSWIFDLTPEGIQKTQEVDPKESTDPSKNQPTSTNKITEEDKINAISRKRVATSSNIIIGLLIIAVCILIIPKIINADRLEEFRDEAGMISVAVLPFDNLTGDSSLSFWERGISEYLINALGNSDELLVSSSEVISDVIAGTREVNRSSLSPEIARMTASKINASTYITGNYIGSATDVSIMLNLVNTQDGELIWSTRVDGDLTLNYRDVLQLLADTVRNHVEIRVLEESVSRDLLDAYPNSAESYRLYIEGLNAIMDSKYEYAVESLKAAYALDTTFTFAAFYIAFARSFGSMFDEELIFWTKRAHELKNNLPPVYRPWIDMWHACYISQDFEDIRLYCDMMFEAAVHSRLLLFDLGVTYDDYLEDYSKAIQAFERIEELNKTWEDDWKYNRFYISYVIALIKANRPEDIERITEIGLQVDPENFGMWLSRAISSLLLNESDADTHISNLESFMVDQGWEEDDREHAFGHMYRQAGELIEAAIHYRRAFELDNTRQMSLMWLIDCQLNSDQNLEECLDLSNYSIKYHENEHASYWSRGHSLFKLGRYEEALEDLHRSANIAVTGPPNKLRKLIREVEQAVAARN